jgi:sugar lactone lactonase YvrE
MVYLPNGDLAIARLSNGTISRITPAGGTSVIANISGLYGLELGPNGDLWAANGSVHRVDPDSGVILETFSTPQSAHVVNFNPEGTRLYIGTIGQGQVYYLDLTADGSTIGVPTLFASNVGTGYHDGLAVDICGYLYIPDYWSKDFYQVAPDGTVNLMINWPGNQQYGHGAVWGNDVGGWRSDAIYAPMPYLGNVVKEIVIEVPGKDWPGIAINLPPATP